MSVQISGFADCDSGNCFDDEPCHGDVCPVHGLADWMDDSKAGTQARIDLLERVQHGFTELSKSGASGVGVRYIVTAIAPLANALTSNSSATQDEKNNAYAMLYHLQRPELSSEDKLPAWLLNQVKDTVYKVLLANNRIATDVELSPTLIQQAFSAAKYTAKESVKTVVELPGKIVSGVPMWAWLVGGAVVVLAGVVLVRSMVPPLPRLHGVEYGKRRKR